MMGGIDAVYRRGFLGVRATALTDLLARSHGQKLRAMLFAHIHTHGWFFDPRAGIEWESANLISYYFGIPEYEASPLRPSYAPGSTINTLLELLVGKNLGDHFTALGGLEEEFYGSGIRASPLVNRSSSLSYVVGLYFRFR
ncbi:MltA-interacting MipA family protein [mine drainage metagenome]